MQTLSCKMLLTRPSLLRNARSQFAKSILASCVILGSSGYIQADERVRQPIEVVLAGESQGAPVDRLAALAPLKETSSTSSATNDQDITAKATHWHSGDIAREGEWAPIAALDPEKLDSADRQYLKNRGENALDIEGHRKLARWSKSKGLTNRAKSHWFGVLEFDNSDIEARQELGFTLIGNRWISPQEVSTAVAKSKSTIESLRQWMPKVREWTSSIEGKDTKKRLKAIQNLREVNDPRVIPALDIAIWQVTSDSALHFIQAIRRFQTREACVSLAGIALNEPSSEVGLAALEALREYPLEYYVPDLLDLMCTEIELKNQVVTRNNGEMVLQLVQSREMRDHYEATQLDKVLTVNQSLPRSAIGLNQAERLINQSLNSPRNRALVFGQVQSMTDGAVVNNVASSIASEEATRIAAKARADTNASNDSVRAAQRNIATVLRAVTNQQLDDQPASWWAWWDKYEEGYNLGPKYVDSSYTEDRSSIVYQAQEAHALSYIPPVRRCECLVLGTQIQTEVGLKSVESIRVGDSVVAQNIETGELHLQPILRTTVRPPANTREMILAGGETIRSTLGHPWWVIGNGWVKTKDLKPGMALRTSTGFAKIDELKDADAIETYNLVVDSDHTYFVGQSRILSFDATELIPTFQKAPGLPAEVLRKE
jgi:hypothetical protein